MGRQHGPWAITSSRERFANEFITVCEDEVIQPDGAASSLGMALTTMAAVAASPSAGCWFADRTEARGSERAPPPGAPSSVSDRFACHSDGADGDTAPTRNRGKEKE